MLGFEDARLFPWDGGLWCSATIRELSSEGWCEQVLARIDRRPGEPCRLMDWRVLTPDGARRHEKNWMPQADGRTLRFLYSCDPTRVVDEHGKTVTEAMPVIATDHFRGGSQMIRFCGGWLTLIHEVSVNGSARHYVHRFVWFDAMNMLRSVSRQFFFHRKGVEYAAGLAWHPDGKCLLISYGVGDSEAWIATVDALEVRRALAGPYKTCGLFGELDAISQIS